MASNDLLEGMTLVGFVALAVVRVEKRIGRYPPADPGAA
jgi:hypothetical protein